MNTLVSIITPTYNSEAFIESTVESVLAQTYTNLEWLIIDDGSGDKTLIILKEKSLKEKRIKLFERNREPKGPSTCRNIGIENSTGEYIIFLDSDDLLAPSCIEKRLAYLIPNPKINFAVFQMETFGSTKNCTTRYKKNYLDSFLKLEFPWTITAPIWRRSFLHKYGGFNEKLNCLEDPELHIRCLIDSPDYTVFYNAEPDCFYRTWKNGDLKKNNNYYLKINSFFSFVETIHKLVEQKNKKKLNACFYIILMILIFPLNLNDILVIKKCISTSRDISSINYLQFFLLIFLQMLLPVSKNSHLQKYIVYSSAFVYSPRRFKNEYCKK